MIWPCLHLPVNPSVAGSRTGRNPAAEKPKQPAVADRAGRFREETMVDGVIAYLDMEFGGICGTGQRMKVPVEAGAVIHDEGTGSVCFAGREFSSPMDVTVWKNVTDDLGRTIGKDPRTIGPDRGISGEAGMRRVRLDREGLKLALKSTRAVHAELKKFMHGLNGCGITTLVFYAADYELAALRQARVNLAGFLIRDLQEEIRSRYSRKDVLSLDRLSYITGFAAVDGCFSSRHFRFPVPEAFRHRMKPHDAIGDAARIFLAAREFECYQDELGGKIGEYLKLCESREKRGTTEETF